MKRRAKTYARILEVIEGTVFVSTALPDNMFNSPLGHDANGVYALYSVTH
tara:strand:- start:749 stop:898 length:150 start_codon:yes stop_codon:yes gene_type:complete